MRDESFNLDLIGFDATELEALVPLADGEAGSAEDESRARRESGHKYRATSGSRATTG